MVGFVIVAATVFFAIVNPMQTLMAHRQTEPDADSPTRACPHCLSEIPAAANRCAFCTADVSPSGR